MVDYGSQQKIYGAGFSVTRILQPAPTTLENNRNTELLVFSTARPQMHDCRPGFLKEHYASLDWEAHILAGGIKKTYEAINEIHHKEKSENEDGVKAPDKLLCDSILRGQPLVKAGGGRGEFHCPRGVAVTGNGDIVVADTLNHRVQVLNLYAMFKDEFGIKGTGKAEFNQPTDVAVMKNGKIVVADSKNTRIQVFDGEDARYRFRYEFPTSSQPYYVTCDKNHNIVVSTKKRTVEVYRRQGALRHKFELGHQGSPLFAPIVANPDKEEVTVCDNADGMIKVYNYEGQQLLSFIPETGFDGLAAQPVSLALSPLGHILVADSLNHCINAYSPTGVLIERVLGPADAVGCVVACTVGEPGHLILTEYSLNGIHCVKVFRYKGCECHRNRPGSAKRATSRGASPTRTIDGHSLEQVKSIPKDLLPPIQSVHNETIRELTINWE